MANYRKYIFDSGRRLNKIFFELNLEEKYNSGEKIWSMNFKC